ncbi:zinc finger containing protein, partial [Cystoisospora suis]
MRNRSLNTHTDYGNSTGMGYLDSTQSSRPHGGGGLNCSSIPTMANIGTAGAPATLTAGEGVGDGRRERGDEGRWEGQQQGRRNERARCFGTPDQGPGGVLVGNSAGGVSRVMGGYQQKQLANEGRDDLFQVKAYRGNANHFSNSHTAAPGTSHHTNSSHVGSCGEVDDVDPFYKTKMCPFMKGGRRTCPKEGNCTFAHSSAELRAPPDFRKTKLCRYSNG